MSTPEVALAAGLLASLPVAGLSAAAGALADHRLSAAGRLRVWRMGLLMCTAAPVAIPLLAAKPHAEALVAHSASPATSPILDAGVLEALSDAFLVATAVGACLGLLNLAYGLWRLTRARLRSRPFADPSLETTIDPESRNSRLPAARISSEMRTVVLTGGWRPVVLIPEGLAAALSEADLGRVCAHEAAHFQRGDHWLAPLEQSLTRLLWFNPWATRLLDGLDAAREEVCDAFALRDATQDERRSYARVLVEALRARSTCAGFPALTKQGDSIMRLTAILSPDARPKLPAWKALAAPILAIAASATAGVACSQALSKAPEPAAAFTIMADELTISTDGQVTTYNGSPSLKFETAGARPLILRDGRRSVSAVQSPDVDPKKTVKIVYFKPQSREAAAYGADAREGVINIIGR